MGRALTRLAGSAVIALVAVGIVFVAGMRTKSPAVLDAVRRFNRSVTNPRVLKSAGAPGAPASVIRHVGRTSGRAYETPVGAIPTQDGFVIALPYGTNADWLRNVLASGSATVVHAGNTDEIDEPEVVSTAAVADLLPPQELRLLRWFRVEQCLRVRRVRN